MVKIGEIRKGLEIGYKSKRHGFIWLACVDCGKERWVALRNMMPEHKRCYSCARKEQWARTPRMPKESPKRKDKKPNNGKWSHPDGYIIMSVPEDCHQYFKRNVAPEHRIVMARNLKRPLMHYETVHHKNGIKDDNRLENLELLTAIEHTRSKTMCSHCELRKEIRLLRWQVKELTEALQTKLKI